MGAFSQAGMASFVPIALLMVGVGAETGGSWEPPGQLA